ncbi:hypothetical protein HTX81_09330 [Pseudomonas lini]|uniref:Rap1a/Tai family immunity protein n=1 Tax=Pseudomonas lini TaxID=163011 RepID=UPI0015731BCB|nr:Rap1a/Tai family immunity protein [Pseudomonas lini]NSX08777.1 hypothetical protein [Pseudomonas lini]
MKALLMAVALVGMLASSGAMAKGADGNELLTQCQSYIKMIDGETNFIAVDAGACGGFVQGVNSTVQFYSDVLKKEDRFCLSDGVTYAQLGRIVVKYLKDNPKQLNKDRTALVWLALIDAYPCK